LERLNVKKKRAIKRIPARLIKRRGKKISPLSRKKAKEERNRQIPQASMEITPKSNPKGIRRLP
jgi:hypothetical protein